MDARNRSFGQSQRLLHKDLFGLRTENLDPVVDHRFWHAGHPVTLYQFGKFSRLDHGRGHEGTRCR